MDLPAEEIVEIALSTIESFCRNDVRRRVREHRVVKEPRAAPSLTPEIESLRPRQQMLEPGLAVAGDWTDTGLPATLESAATSGHRAATLLHSFLGRGS